ncbi:hypothetical protein [Burkholderia gladioli]|jgi:hypothetical protein|uniref:hypothetical protein n=1 Tax=Burkholderia gladioli TaxID=28095 RepID=UPI001641EFC4|nr:hypothetical protein [Burkholderia gladioli]MBU9641077.1 nucleoside 2-deoxyribosyltransferase [Burkholderia gladioli]
MTPQDAVNLIELCDRAINDLKRFDGGAKYKDLQIVNTFQTIVAPLLSAGELIPELRKTVPSTELFNLKKCIFGLQGANSFQGGKAEYQYADAVRYIKNALERYQRETTIPTVKENGPWTVFYSWQSTLPNSTNRALIRTCIDKAVDALNAEMNVEDSLRVDSDTSGRPGSPKIFDTILEKIKQCDVFIADVSLVEGKQANSNVMVELGYALSLLGSDGIVMVYNTAFGSISDLPFDLGFNRVIPYSCTKEEEGKAAVRAALIPKLKAAIDGICRPAK